MLLMGKSTVNGPFSIAFCMFTMSGNSSEVPDSSCARSEARESCATTAATASDREAFFQRVAALAKHQFFVFF
jgi:hypothetical protein